MTRRSLLWIAATAGAAAAATSGPSVAAVEPGAGWTITVDEPAVDAVVESKHLTIQGAASTEAGVDDVTVTVVPHGLPPQCGPETGPARVEGDRWVIELDVTCNGPHEIHVVAKSAGDTAAGEPRIVGVEERPPRPAPPGLDVTGEGGLRATWDPGQDPDADGTILVVDFREDRIARGIGEAFLPPSDRRASVAVRSLRWGAGGPGTTISSPESGGNYIADSNPQGPNASSEPPPPQSPPATPPPPLADGSGRGFTPRPRSGGSTTSLPSGSASSTTVAPGPGESLPAAPVGIGPDSARRPPADVERRALSTPPSGGLVRTGDKRTPGLIALLGIALLAIGMAARIAWRSRSPHPRS